MSSDVKNLITLEQAKELVSLLEQKNQTKADELLVSIAEPLKTELFGEVGKLTRQLHDSMNQFSVDPQVKNLQGVDFSDAKEGLNYVIRITEDAANKTMDLADELHPLTSDLQNKLEKFIPIWRKLLSKEIDVNQFQKLCHDIDIYFDQVFDTVTKVTQLTNDIVVAQGFQDLSGQVLRRTIDVIQDVQSNLIDILKLFSDSSLESQKTNKSGTEAEGPIMNAEKRSDVAKSQDEVDDLLSSLGF